MLPVRNLRHQPCAPRLGLTPRGLAPTNEQLLALGRLGQTAPPARAAPRAAQLEPHRERIAKWLREEKLQLTRIAELLEPDVAVTYPTLRRFVRSQGLAAAPRDTVRMVDTAPGEVAEFDFGRLGRLTNPTTAWAFFAGIPRRLIFDNFPAAVAGADALNPVFTRGFLEYSQAPGFIADPARVTETGRAPGRKAMFHPRKRPARFE